VLDTHPEATSGRAMRASKRASCVVGTRQAYRRTPARPGASSRATRASSAGSARPSADTRGSRCP
jgi:hypothetical protein